MPNVAAVSPGGNVFGYYRNPKTHAGLMMVGDEAGWLTCHSSRAQWAQWRARPDGAFLSRATATRWGVKKGSIFSIIDGNTIRADGGHAWRFEVLDVLDDTPYWPGGFSLEQLPILQTVTARRRPGQGRLRFQALVKNPAAAEDTAIAIDARFANSAIPTVSISERLMRSYDGHRHHQRRLGDAAGGCSGAVHDPAADGPWHGPVGARAPGGIRGAEDHRLFGLGRDRPCVRRGSGACHPGRRFGTAQRIDCQHACPISLPSLSLPEPYLSLTVMAQALFAVILLTFLSVILPALRLRRLDVAAVLAGRT